VSANEPAPVNLGGPIAPRLTAKDLWRQVWADAYGKEVQSAATYSYMWLADQVGHVCVGIVVDFAATAAIGSVMVFPLGWQTSFHYDAGVWPGLALTVIGVSTWEWSAYRSSVKQATGVFPLDTKLLRDNAVIAATYMSLGALLGFGFHLPRVPAILIAAVVVMLAIVLAPRWLRQKIIWQKASIPYLFRLADAAPNIERKDATLLQNLINDGAPPAKQPCQIVIGGPIGSGRTPMAAGIATEFAFKQNKVRYLSLDCLLEFAANSSGGFYPDDPGPTTISYWPWSEAQVVIIDGIGPVMSVNEPGREANFARFRAMLQNDLKSIADVLRRCHTIWILGDLCPPPPRAQLSELLADFARAVAEYCDSPHDPFVVELSSPPERLHSKGPLLPTTRSAAHIIAVRSVRQVSRIAK
jgi:hypothetical protein